MLLYNTDSNQLEEIKIPSNKKIRVYSCGPTVYDFAHIGNFRSFILADVLVRALTLCGAEVEWVMNITDIDDKTIKKTVEKYGETANTKDLYELTTSFYHEFLKDLENLNIKKETIKFIRVTDVIPEIQEFILKLIDKGYAYKADDGSTYFSIEKYQKDFKNYGKLVGEKFLLGKKVGARIQNDEYEKDNLSDFALWKTHTQDEGQIFWDHPLLGKGRPGWHIECSVINEVAFQGNPTDIHTGGIDLIFPHHTNEIAQTTPLHTQFVHHWFHSEHMLVDGKKMSKSLQNFYTLKDLQSKGIPPLALRYLVLTGHYKKQTNFTFDALEAAKNGLLNIIENTAHLQSEMSSLSGEYKEKFLSHLTDDLNIPLTLALVQELFKDHSLTDAKKRSTLDYFDELFGFNLQILSEKLYISEQDLPDNIKTLIAERENARILKNWKKSDEIRNTLNTMGFLIEDSETGSRIKRKIF